MRLHVLTGAGLAALALAACHPADRPIEDTARPSEVAQATNATARDDASAVAPLSAAAEAASDDTASSPAMSETRTTAAADAGAARTVSGTVTGFETGDYNHVLIRTSAGGEPESFFLGGGDAVGPFLVAHRGQPVQVTVQQRREHSEFAGGEIDMAVVEDARTERETAAAWWSRQSAADRARLEAEATRAMTSR